MDITSSHPEAAKACLHSAAPKPTCQQTTEKLLPWCSITGNSWAASGPDQVHMQK